MQTTAISFIGFGNMAQAIATGLLKQGYTSLFASAPSLVSDLSKEGITICSNNQECVNKAKIIILAVKPMQMQQVLKEIIPVLKPDILLISVAAGLNLSWFAKQGCEKFAVIRTMPNTPVAMGLGTIPMVANVNTSKVQHQGAQTIFSALGKTIWVEDEKEMDIFTALSGSGPAYIYYFMESMIDSAVALGLSEEIAALATYQTVQGALTLAKSSNLDLHQLRTKVTSPKGTTAAALDILHPKLHDLMEDAIKAAKKRANELGDQVCQL